MNKKGMTLIEILMVIVLITIIIGVGISGITRYGTLRLSGEAAELVGDLRYARQMSVTEQIHYAVRFNFDENSYQIIKYGDEENIVKTKIFPAGTEMEKIEECFEVKFTLFGAAFKSGKVLLKGEDFEKIIEIRPSGFIHVERNDIN